MQYQTVWNSYFFNGAISSKEALFQESYFFRKSVGPRTYFLGGLLLTSDYSLRGAAFTT